MSGSVLVVTSSEAGIPDHIRISRLVGENETLRSHIHQLGDELVRTRAERDGLRNVVQGILRAIPNGQTRWLPLPIS